MSADNSITINLNNFKVIYWMGDGEIRHYDCKSLWKAVKKAQELDNKIHTEYGTTFIGRGKSDKQRLIKQIRELQEEPTREGVIDLIEHEKDISDPHL